MSFRVGEDRIVLDIQTTNAKVNIESPPPKMSVKTVKAEMKIERQAPSFRKVRAKRAGKSVRKIQLSRIKPEWLKPLIRETTQRIIADRNSKRIHLLENNISKLPPGSDPISGINAYIDENNEEETQTVWDPGYIKATWTQPRVIVEWDIRRPIITVEPYSIKITPRRKGALKAGYRPKQYKQTKTIDKKI